MDRLSELRGKYAQVDVSIDVQDSKAELDGFFKQVVIVQNGIKYIEQHTDEIKAKHSEAILCTDNEQSKEITSTLDKLMGEVTTKSQEVKQSLKLMEEQTKLINPNHTPAELRIRQNQHQQLTNHFVSAMKTYMEASDQYSQKYKDQIKRRIKTRFSVSKDGEVMSEEEVETYARRLLEEGKEDAIFQQSKDTLEQIQENHRDILRIEQSMRELQQIFTDMAVLVEEQGELMDDILVNIGKSVEYVKEGRANLATAKKYAKKSRKKLCCIMLVLVAIICIILIGSVVAAKILKK